MLRWKSNYIIVLLMICFSIFVHPLTFLAKVGNDSKQTAFLDFEKEVLDLIASSMEPLGKLDKLDGKVNEESLYNIALMAKEEFTRNSLILAKLKVPTILPDDIKGSLEKVKSELSIGFKAMEESMDYLAQYMVNRNPVLYDKYIERHKRGFLYIDGGLTSLTTVRLRLDAPKRPIPHSTSGEKSPLPIRKGSSNKK